MKKAIKKVVSTILTAATLSTCVVFPASISNAATVGRNTPHNHGQFCTHKYVYRICTNHFYDKYGEEFKWLEYWVTDTRYCGACGGEVGSRTYKYKPDKILD